MTITGPSWSRIVMRAVIAMAVAVGLAATAVHAQDEPLRSRIPVLVDSSARMLLTPEMITYTEVCTGSGWSPCVGNNQNPPAFEETCNACVIDTINFRPSCANGWSLTCVNDYANCLTAVTGQGSCSATMTYTDGVATRGDGSLDLTGCDVDGDGLANDSRMYQAKEALGDVVGAFSGVEFSLWRYAQVTGGQTCTTDTDCPITTGSTRVLSCEDHDANAGTPRVCALDADILDGPTSAGFEGQCNRFTYTGSPNTFTCNACDFNTTYDRASCRMFDLDQVRTGGLSPLTGLSAVQCFPAANTNHRFMRYHGGFPISGPCAPNGGERLVPFPATGFQSNYNAILAWIDHTQIPFATDVELRPTGNRPIAASIRDMRASLLTSLAADPRTPCRNYKVILIAGGGESCEPQSNAVSAAAALQDLSFTNPVGRAVTGFDVDVHVIGFGVCPPTQPACQTAQDLNAIAAAGGTGTAVFVSNQAALQVALTSILTGSESSCPPSVTTGAATAITDTSATLHASVNPNGSATSASFAYGPTTSYGGTTALQGLGSGYTDVPTSATVSGLDCGTLYHFRAAATSSTGAADGADLTFTTSGCPPLVADLSITKTDGLTTAEPGQPVTYTIQATNAGPNAAVGSTLTDTVPLLGVTWSCLASPGSSCTGSGSGNINQTVDLLVGGTVTYTVTGTVDPGATGTLVNTATVAVPPGANDPDPVNNSATDTDTLVDVQRYFTLAPCRVVDTRGGAPIGGPILQGQATRTFALAGNCGIPSTAKAVSINLAVTQPTATGNVRLFPAGQAVPTISSINYATGQTRGNNAIVQLDGSGALAAFVGQPAGTTVHLILDVNGYFE